MAHSTVLHWVHIGLTFRLGSKWEEGIFSNQVLKHSATLLPLDETLQCKPEAESHVHASDIPSSKCICNVSTNNSSSFVERKRVVCECNKSITDSEYNKKERHMSIDSAKDSGIGENSNFTDRYDDTSDENEEKPGSSFCLELTNNPSTSAPSMIKVSEVIPRLQINPNKLMITKLLDELI